MTLGKVWNKASTKVMVYGGDWNSAQTTVRSSVFAKMLELARDRVKFYVSDLYHDALWLNEEVHGPTTFEWVPRESGTHIGETAKIVKDDDWADSARYRFEIREDGNQKWVLDTWELVVHEGTPIEDCASAMTGPGCIYHPGPIANVCTGVYSDSGMLQHDGDTCPVHENLGVEYLGIQTHTDLQTGDWREEVPGTGKNYYGDPIDLGAKYRDAMQEEIVVSDSAADDIINMLFARNPTPRNDLNVEPNAPIRKVNTGMDDIIRDLRDKVSEAESAKEELENGKYDLDQAIDDLDTYINEVEELIGSLDSLPEVNVSFELDVNFDS